MEKITRVQMGALIEDLYTNIEALKESTKISDTEGKQISKDMISEFISKNRGRVEAMNDKEFGEYVEEVLNRIQKAKTEKSCWR